MSTYTIRPTAVLGKDGGLEGTADSGSSWATASDVTAAGHLSDASDATGVRADADDMRWTQFDLAAPTIPGDEFIARVAGFLRWSHGTAGKYVGVQPYLPADGIPGYASTVIVDGRTTPTTTEPGYVARAWTTAEAAALALQVQIQGDATPADRPRLWEAGATLYALKQATATPQATTITGTTYPTIPVQVACTIDWEAGTPNWMGLRKVTVDLRVESGGTGVGTGTLVSSTQADVWFTATGTITANVVLPDSLPNGTYKVYARAIRHRENESAPAADQISAWSASATLTMTVTPPTTPTISVAVNDVLDRVAVSVTPVATAGYATPYVTIERSDDAGTTWSPIRLGTAVAGVFGNPLTVNDDEAPRGITVKYRARVSAYTSGVLNTSVNSALALATLTPDTWNLKCPQAPAINAIGITVIGEPTDGASEDVGVFRPLGRRYPVTVAGTLGGWDGDLEIACANTAEWVALKDLIECQAVLLLESPFGWAKYIRLLPNTVKARMRGSASLPRRLVSVSYVETSAPIGVTTILPTEIDIVIDFGAAATAVWDDTIDGGAAGTSSWAGTADGGSAA